MSGDRDLNALLRWSIENDPQATQRVAAALSSNPSTGLALHPSDPEAAAAAAASSNVPQSKEEIDAILAALSGRQGKQRSEADLMVEQMAVAMGKVTVDGGKAVDHEERIIALDNFEMLIESIDNANLLQPLKLWKPLLSLLHPSEFESELSTDSSRLTPEQVQEIQAAAAWIIGTAVQNNPKCQTELLSWGIGTGPGAETVVGSERPITTLLRLLLSSPSVQVRNKAAYALSALLKHYPAAVRHFSQSGPSTNGTAPTLDLDHTSCLAGWGVSPGEASAEAASSTSGAQAWFSQHGRGVFSSGSQAQHGPNGWTVLAQALLDPSMLVRRKIAFLINSLLLQWSEAEAEVERVANLRADDDEGSRPAPAGAPVELPPETMREGSLRYEGVLGAIVEQGVIRNLALSLLPESDATAAAHSDVSVYAGPNGDEEPRRDEDYAEKAMRAIVSFAHAVDTLLRKERRATEERETVEEALSSDGWLSSLLSRIVTELEGPALGEASDGLEEEEGASGTRWEQLGVEKSEVEWLSRWISERTKSA
ncbi:hsp70 nucleotide exchange factor fes1 [Tilletia horrida]|nr:hsp70 nucleotide exchange factor fes1 [Tilletia horrida]